MNGGSVEDRPRSITAAQRIDIVPLPDLNHARTRRGAGERNQLGEVSAAVFGQRHRPPEEVDAEKPDGKLMQQIMQESDPAKKNALMEQYANEFPKTPT